jgi:tetratricopeptide (TPR) repeat protein
MYRYKTLNFLKKKRKMKKNYMKLILAVLFSSVFLNFSYAADEKNPAAAKANKKTELKKVDASSFIIIKNKTPEQMFDDANYLYQLGEYESALILFNKVSTQSSDPILKRKSNTAREVIDILMKAERVGDEKSPKEFKRAEKIKARQKNEQIAYLYNEARGKFLKNDFETAIALYRIILQLDPAQKEAKDYLEVKIPATQTAQKVAVISKEGVDYFERGNYTGATSSFKEIIKLDPKNQQAKEYLDKKIPLKLKEQKAAALYVEAQTALNKKEYDKAKVLCQDILALDSKNQDAKTCLNAKIPAAIKDDKIKSLLSEGKAVFEAQKYDQATVIFKNVLTLDSNQQQAKEYLNMKIPQKIKESKIDQLYAKGLNYFNAKDYDNAAKAFQEIVKLSADEKGAQEFLDIKIPQALAEVKAAKIKSLYEQATAAFDAQKYDQAIAIFKNILTLDANQQKAKEYLDIKIPQKLKENKIEQFYSKGLSYFDSKDYDNAAKAFQEITKLSADEKRAQEYLDIKIPQALAEEKAAKIKSLYEQATSAFDKGDLEGSTSLFNQIIFLDSTQAQAKDYVNSKIPAQKAKVERIKQLYSEGAGYFNTQDFVKAESAFKEIVELDPGQAQAREYLDSKIPLAQKNKNIQDTLKEAVQYFTIGDCAKASELFNQLLSLDPDNTQAKDYLENRIPVKLKEQKIRELYAQGQGFFNVGYYDDAKNAFKEILELSPDEPVAQEYLDEKIPAAMGEAKVKELYEQAKGAFLVGNLDAARDAFSEILSISPDEAEAKDYLENIIPEEKDKAKVRELYEQGKSAFDSADYEGAKKAFEEVVSLSPDEEGARDYLDNKIPAAADQVAIKNLYEQAMQAFDSADYVSAIKFFKDIVAIDSSETKAQEYLQTTIPGILRDKKVKEIYDEAVASFNNQDYDKASDLFAKVLALDPNQTEAKEYIDTKILQKQKEQKELAQEQERVKQKKLEEEIQKNKQEKLQADLAQEKEKQAQQETEDAAYKKKQDELEQERLRSAKLKREQAISKTVTSESGELDNVGSSDYPKEGAIGYLYERAFNAYNSGDLQEARDCFTNILLVAPKEKVAMKYLVKIIKKQKNED